MAKTVVEVKLADTEEFIAEFAKMTSVKLALNDYHQALRDRQNGYIAAQAFIWECEKILNMPFEQ